jgi:small neutral amino acid transporter SnatA (MarC family)
VVDLDDAPPPRRAIRRAAIAGVGLAVAAVVVFGVVAPPERCPAVSADDLREAAGQTVDWFVRNQQDDGTWLYLYDAEAAEAIDDYNVVRHSGVIMGLFQAAAAGIPGALESADRGLEWAVDRLVERGDWTAVNWRGQTPVGATALLAAGLVDRRAATGDRRHDALMDRLGNFLAAQTEPSGAVLAYYDLSDGAPIAGSYSKYYTGEAYWALARLHVAFPEAGWGEVSDRVGGYLAAHRDDAEDYWPPIADHWAAYGLAETVTFPDRGEEPLTAEEVAYARRQAGMFGGQVRWVSQRFGPWGLLVRGSFVPRGGGYGVIGEALTGLWLAAGGDARLADLRPALAERASCIAALAIDTQSDGEEAARFDEPGRVEGAWFRDGETRMDDQQHVLAALLRTIPIAQASDDVDGSDGRAPSAWLWLVALVVALNPCRAAFGVPRAGRPRGEVIGVAALGGAIGVLAVAVAAFVAGPLLDALGVSGAAFRVAAGGLAAVMGAADLVLRPPAPEPALSGWRAALVPVAVPLVLRPVVVVLALSAGVDRGVALTAGAVAIGVALVVAAVAWVPEAGPGERVLRWGARLAGAAAFVAGMLLAIDGVLDV